MKIAFFAVLLAVVAVVNGDSVAINTVKRIGLHALIKVMQKVQSEILTAEPSDVTALCTKIVAGLRISAAYVAEPKKSIILNTIPYFAIISAQMAAGNRASANTIITLIINTLKIKSKQADAAAAAAAGVLTPGTGGQGKVPGGQYPGSLKIFNYFCTISFCGKLTSVPVVHVRYASVSITFSIHDLNF